MTTLTANSNFYKPENGSIKKGSSTYTPNQKTAITESSSTMTSSTATPIISNPNSATSGSTINAFQSSDTDEISLSEEESHSTMESLQLIKDLDLFLVTAPVNWHENQVIRRYFLNKEEGFVSCVYWNNLYFITGTDIVRCIAYKMGHIGREIVDRKKFEEGIFSDLRALKCGTHAILENSRSQFLKFLHRNQCIRTQKKQKVFFWFSVPHNKLFTDVLERDLKRELSNQPATTKAISPVFKTFQFDQSLPLLEQLSEYYSKVLRKDVSHLLLNSSNLIPADGTKKGLDTADEGSPTKLNQPTSATNRSMNSNQIADDFPLDFLDPSNQMLDENYITSIHSMDSARTNGKFYIDGQGILDDQMLTPRKNFQLQFYQQFQPHNQESLISPQYPDHFDGVLLNPNQPLFSATPYGQQQLSQVSQPLFVLSNLPSAIEPTNIMSAGQTLGRNSPMSAGFSQYLPISLQNTQRLASPSAFMMNNENQFSFDQVFIPTNDQFQQQNQMYSEMKRTSSPLVTNGGASAYMNIPSATFMPMAMHVQRPEDTSNNIQNPNKEQEQENATANTEINEQHTSNKEGSAPHTAKPEISEPKQTPVNPQPKKQDYMMIMPSYNTANRLNFGIIGGQIFTPGSIGMEYSFDNSALSAGVGISPVIGFNNGLLSAIQYQPSKQLPSKSNQNVEEDDREVDDDNDMDTEEHEEHEEVEEVEEETEADKEKTTSEDKPKKLKGILLNDKEGRVSKKKNVKMRSKMNFLNPTLRHLELDDVFEGGDEFYSDEEETEKKQTKEKR